MGKRITIIGSGPGGYKAAVRAAQLGSCVTVIERNAVGGTCLNWGCIPTKTLKTSAEMLHNFRKASSFGITVTGDVLPDIQGIMARKDKVVYNLAQGIHELFKSYNIKYLNGIGTLKNSHTVSVKLPGSNAVDVISDAVILATGSSPLKFSSFPFDGNNILSVNDVLTMNDIPESVIILGGGVIGSELAFILSSFGTRITVVEARDRLIPLPSVDDDISTIILREMKKHKIRVLLDRTIDTVSIKDSRVIATTGVSPFSHSTEKPFSDPEHLEADKLLVTIGRQANTENMELDRIGVKIDSLGWIEVNGRMETTVTDVYAIGDALGPEKIMLAHVASAEGMVAVENALGGNKTMDYSVIPSTFFTFPEAASVGLTGEQAKDQGYSVRINSFLFRLLGKSQAMGEITGQVKIISDARNKKILGVHIVGPHASDLIAEGVLALQLGATVEDLASTIHAHPTLSEALMEASNDALGLCIHCPPR